MHVNNYYFPVLDWIWHTPKQYLVYPMPFLGNSYVTTSSYARI